MNQHVEITMRRKSWHWPIQKGWI